MVRALHIISVLTIISAVSSIVLLAVQHLQRADETEQNPELTIVERFNMAGDSREKSPQGALNPLVEQAQSFALYLNPPKPEPQKTRVVPKRRTLKAVNKKVTAAESTKLKPKFKLVGTSYYHPDPDKSMALVSEPGKETRWVKKGGHLGYFIIDEVKRGMIVYRDGDTLREMAVDTKVPVYMQQDSKIALASNTMKKSRRKLSTPDRPQETRPRRLVSRLGPRR